jgi:nucleotide-binding universal stress UspA family protein
MTFTEAGATKGIVVGVRDSDRSRDAVAFARTLAGECGAPVVIATAYRPLGVPEYPEPTNIEELLLAEAEVTLGRMRAEARGVPADVVALCDASPARALHRLAERRGAALIVIGSSHRGEVGRVLAGTTAERLLHGAPCPVAVVPEGYRFRAGPIRSVVVAYDGSPQSGNALAIAARAARTRAAAVHVVQVVPLVPPGSLAAISGAALLAPPAELAREARAALDDELAAIDGGERISAEVVVGDPMEILADRSLRADMILAGSRGYGHLRAVLLGSVTGRLVRRAACPVLVVPRSGGAGTTELGGALTGRATP